jgi:hypothetical protein
MIAAIFLVAVAILYRVVLGIAGMHDMQWLHNFSPLAAIALCGAIYFPRRAAVAGPLVALLVSDVALNASYGVPLLGWRMLPEYLALGISITMGLALRARPRALPIVGASLAGSIAFYLITNSADWLADPAYAKNAAGWLQALTTGVPGYPPTWVFFRNSLASDLIFTVLFLACMAWRPARRTALESSAASHPCGHSVSSTLL